MPVDPADKTIRLDVADILSMFLSEYGWTDGPLAKLRDQVFERYMPSPVDAYTLNGLLRNGAELGLRDQGRFLFLQPIVDEMILPLLTLHTSDDWVHFRAYVLLTMLDESEGLQALAIRFETNEGSSQANGVIGSHDFCHAQLCRYIGAKRATTKDWLPESQPSFPLDASDQVGLVLCMLMSLYGGRYVVTQLTVTGDRHLRKHLNKVRALASKECAT